MALDNDNSLPTAQNLGTLPDRIARFSSGSVNLIDDPSDFFRFSLSKTSTVRFNLSGGNSNTTLELIRDADGDGRVDQGEGILRVGSSSISGFVDGLAAGTYFLRTSQGNSRLGGGNQANYTMNVTAFPGAGIERVNDTPENATVVQGNLNGNRIYKGDLLVFDKIDFYKFQIGVSPSQFNATLVTKNTAGANADLRLFRDANRDGFIAPTEQIASSAQPGTRLDSISTALNQGTYFLQVVKPDGASNTEYDLTFNGAPNTGFNVRNVPVSVGTFGNDTITGQAIGGIVNAKAGNDKVNAAGGNDIVLGGTGNDVLNGSTGDDLLDGGSGRNVLTGGTGKDTFVLAPQGLQIIQDFRNGMDRLGLAKGLSFESLEIVQLGANTVIQAGSDQIGILKNVQANTITAADFVQVSYAKSGNMMVPTVIA